MGMLKATAKVGSWTLVSRVLGLVRDIVFATYFGAGKGTDAFFVAFKIPNFFRRLFAEGAFSQAFVPVLAEYKTQREHAEVQSLVRAVSGTLGAILLVLTIVAMLAAPAVVSVFAPGFLLKYPDKFVLTAELLRITFPYLMLISLTALAGGILNTYGRFGVPAFTPVLLNVSLITAAIWFAPQLEEPRRVVALAWGVFAAGVVQLAFQLPFLARLRLLRWPRWGWRDSGVRRILKLMLPAVFGSSVAQINLLFDTVIASFLVTGSVTWLYYSDRLVEFPLGVFGIALATVILPTLSEQHARSSPEQFARTLDWALRWVVLIGVPATLGLVILAGPILTTLFQHGDFTSADVIMARLSLMAYGLGLLGFIMVKVLAPGFYARQDTRTPVRIGIIAMVANMVLNVAFVVPLAWFEVSGAHAGLALATSLAAFVNAGLLLRGLVRDGVFRAQPGWARLLLQCLSGCSAMALVLWWLGDSMELWSARNLGERLAHLLLNVGAGVGVYFAALHLLGLRWRTLRSPPPPKGEVPTQS